MGYATVNDMRRILPEKVQIGSNNIGTPSMPGRPGNQGSTRSNISPEQAEYYIEYASSWLDGRLRPFYSCPLRRIKVYETLALSDINHGSPVSISVEDSGSFIRGLLVRIQDKSNMEIATVIDAPTLTTFIVDRVTGNYLSSDGTKVSIVKYPDPIPLIVTQMAVSFVLDRLWMSEQSPDSSKYGTTMRNLARAQIENILSGEIILFGQEMTSRRFVRMSLLDKWSSPVGEIQKGTEKE